MINLDDGGRRAPRNDTEKRNARASSPVLLSFPVHVVGQSEGNLRRQSYARDAHD